MCSNLVSLFALVALRENQEHLEFQFQIPNSKIIANDTNQLLCCCCAAENSTYCYLYLLCPSVCPMYISTHLLFPYARCCMKYVTMKFMYAVCSLKLVHSLVGQGEKGRVLCLTRLRLTYHTIPCYLLSVTCSLPSCGVVLVLSIEA